MSETILVLDEGTTSTRAILFDRDGLTLDTEQSALTQSYPQAGWVEHDAQEIWDRTLKCAQAVVARADGGDEIACIGITNQRETVVAWDRTTGEPLAPAIVWQDRRTAALCAQLKQAGHEPELQQATGLVLDPYFSATKMRWLIDNVPDVAEAAKRERLAFGTIDSWLIFKLTGGAHVTDASNASRTLLMTLTGEGFDDTLCDLFGVPRKALATVVDCAGQIGTTAPDLFGRAIPISGMAGDQQAATIGQACLSPGETKATYGTGAFVLANHGTRTPASRNRLLGTVLWQIAGRRTYALEGSVFVAGSLVQWLRDSLGILGSAAETESLARSIATTGGVTIVPALSGLGAPHWNADARGVISGLSFSSGKAEIARAALEAMAHQTHDLAAAFAADGAKWTALKVDGGMSANDWMTQDNADILNLEVTRPDNVETTALGAAMLAAVGSGLYPDLAEAAAGMRGPVKTFVPAMDEETRASRLAGWTNALRAI